jgi:hypothetical protein
MDVFEQAAPAGLTNTSGVRRPKQEAGYCIAMGTGGMRMMRRSRHKTPTA